MPPTVVLNALSLSRNFVGGDLIYVRELVGRIGAVSSGLRLAVLVQRGAGTELLGEGTECMGLRLPLASRWRTARVLYEQFIVPYVALRLRADLLHAPVNVAPFKQPCPSVLTVHECEPFKGGAGIPRHIKAWWVYARRRSASLASLILTPSVAAKEDVATYLGVPAGKVVVTPLGVDERQFWPDEGEAMRWRAQLGSYFLWVGVPYPRKNLTTLFEAFAAMGRADITLALAGPAGWGSPTVQASLSRLGIGGKVAFLGTLAGAKLRGAYSGAVALVFPSIEETFGLPVLESMACGTPVIASDIAVFREVSGGAALLVDPYSPSALAQAMRAVLEDKDLRRELRDRGLERARSFTWERTAELTVEGYRMVLKCV